MLLSVTLLAGCGTTTRTAPDAWITPGPPLPARPGAHVWVVGLPDVVLTSADGGASWTLAHQGMMTNDSLGDLWGVAFGDAAHGWAVERGSLGAPSKILATADGGARWTWQYPGPSGKLLAVAATGARRAWAVGYQASDTPLMLVTSDGGTTWREQSIRLHHLQLYDVAFADARHGWALGGSDPSAGDLTYSVLATVDGGAHWRVTYNVSYQASRMQLSRLACAGTQSCWVVGHSEAPGNQNPGLVLATTDGGAHWRVQPSVTTQPLSDVAFPDAQHGCAVGPSGTIIATSDGGTTWTADRKSVV